MVDQRLPDPGRQDPASRLRNVKPGGDFEDRRLASEVAHRLFGDLGDGPLQIGRFEVVRRIGAGGMGVVYEARDPQLDRHVALKVIDPKGSGRPERRLLREARSVARLSHPNAVTVHDAGTDGDNLWIAMELVRGPTLRTWLAEGPSIDSILEIFRQAGEGLAAAHRAGIVHRDFKPENVLVQDDTPVRARVVDFGLASHLDEDLGGSHEVPSGTPAVAGDEQVPPTMVTAFAGTPGYMSPEQLDSASIDERADQFAWSVALVEAICGRRPFSGRTIAALRESMDQPTRLDTQLPRWLRPILRRGLSLDRRQRYPTMDALLADLVRRPRRRQQTRLVGAVAVVATSWVLWPAAEAPDLCERAGSRWGEVWTPQRADSVRSAISTYGAMSPAAAAAVRRIDSWGERWVAARERSCRATNVDKTASNSLLDLRQSCLDRQLEAVDAVVLQLEEPDAEVLSHLSPLLAGIPDTSACEDPERLRRELPPLDSVRDRAEALRREAQARVPALYSSQRPVILERLAVMQREAAALGHAATLAEIALVRSRGLYIAGEQDKAVEAASLAIEAAERGRSDELAAHAAIALGSALLKGPRAVREAERWLQAGEAKASSLADSHRFRMSLLQARNAIALLRGRYDVAETLAREAMAIRAADPLLHGHPSQSRVNVATALLRQGKVPAAEREYRRACREIERELGGDFPALGSCLQNLAVLLHRNSDKQQEALELVERSIEIRTRALGADSPTLIGALQTRASIHVSGGRLELAEADLLRALAVSLDRFGPQSQRAALAHYDLGVQLLEMKRYEPARVEFAAAAELLPGKSESAMAFIAGAWSGLGLAYLGLDQFEAAARAFERSIAEADAAGRPSFDRAEPRYGLARALAGLPGDEPPRARRLAREASDLCSSDPNCVLPGLDEWLRARE